MSPKPSRWKRFGRVILANSAVVALLLFLLAGSALAIVGVFLLAGVGWSLITGSAVCLFAAWFLRHGMVRK